MLLLSFDPLDFTFVDDGSFQPTGAQLTLQVTESDTLGLQKTFINAKITGVSTADCI